MKLKDILSKPINRKVKIALVLLALVGSGTYLNYKWKNDMTHAWLEGCVESVVYTNRIGFVDVSTLLFYMCVERHSQIKGYSE